MLSSILHDFRQATRSLRKSPGFVAAAVIVMGLGIGANSAMFSVVNTVLVRPLPYADPARLVQVWHVPPQRSFPGVTRFSVSPANYLDWKAMNHVFENAAIFGYRGLNLTGVDKPEAFAVAAVESSFFSVLGTQPMLGRTFTADEDQVGHDHVVVLSHAFWRNHFGEQKSVVGKTVQFDGEPYTVVGVMPPNFALPRFADLWKPLALSANERMTRGIHNYLVIARLKPGVTVSQANAELSSISDRLAQAYPADDNGWGAMSVSLREEIVGNLRPALLMLLGAVMFVLLIACANIANLLLARTLARKHEIAIRLALGVSRTRLMQLVITESVAISLLGGIAGLVLAHFSIQLIVKFLSDSLPRSTEIGLDAQVLLFTLVIALATGVLSGLVPAWRFASGDASEALKESAGRTGTEAGGSRTRAALVTAEVALSLMLVVGAGLMIRTLWNLEHTDPGFDTRGTLTMSLGIPATRYKNTLEQSQAMGLIRERVKAAPGVQGVAMIDSLPLTGGSHQPVQAEGQPVVQMSDQPEVAVRTISPGYLKTMGIPLLKGRDISDSDNSNAPGAVLISKAMAHRIWPNQDALGKHLTLTFAPDKMREVVGIVGDVKLEAVSSEGDMSALYVPIAQGETPKGEDFRSRPMYLVARSSGNPAAIAPGVVNAIHAVDSGLPVLEILPMEDFIAETLTSERMNLILLLAFAGLALTLAAVGIYSVIAYMVRRRIREIGIRMALGAQTRDIVRLVITQSMRPVLVGVAVGVGLSVAMGRAVASLVFGVRPTDIATLASGCVVLLAVAMIASLMPAYRATEVVPVSILREE